MNIKQEKTDEELINMGEEIIQSLDNFNLAEKYKIIASLYTSLIETCKEKGLIFNMVDSNEKRK